MQPLNYVRPSFPPSFCLVVDIHLYKFIRTSKHSNWPFVRAHIENVGEHFSMDKPIEEGISILVALWLHGTSATFRSMIWFGCTWIIECSVWHCRRRWLDNDNSFVHNGYIERNHCVHHEMQ